MGDPKPIAGDPAVIAAIKKQLEEQFRKALLPPTYVGKPLVDTGSLRGVLVQKIGMLNSKLEAELLKADCPPEWDDLPEEEREAARRVTQGLRPRLRVGDIDIQVDRNHPVNSVTMVARASLIPSHPARLSTWW